MIEDSKTNSQHFKTFVNFVFFVVKAPSSLRIFLKGFQVGESV